MSAVERNSPNLELIRPEVYWIRDQFGRRCYRRNVPSVSSFSDGGAEGQNAMAAAAAVREFGAAVRLSACGLPYDDGDEPPCGVANEEDNFEITYNEKCNNFSTRMSVANVYYKHIIGRQAETRRRLEDETKTRVDVPKIGFDGDIVITGINRSNVASCRRRIEMLVESARQRQPFTHFLSLPFNCEEIVANFITFKQLVLEECSESRGVEESIFQNPMRLHLTIGMLVLLSNNERTIARATLEECKNEVITPHLSNVNLPLSFHLKGLNYMNDDLSDVHVLYGNVEPAGDGDLDVLQTLTNKIADYFVLKNITPRKQHEAVKLHVTLMNTRYRASGDLDEDQLNGQSDDGPARVGGFYGRGRSSEEPNRDNNGKRESFDARKILEKFHDFDFGIQQLNDIHISQRHSRRADGYYSCTASVSLY